MPDTQESARRRAWWIVALIVFMVALAAVYMILAPQRPHRSPASVDVVSTKP